MLDRESYALVQLLGPEDPQVKALVYAARDPKMRDSVFSMLQALARQRGIDPDNPPAFGFPQGLSSSDYPLGHAKCGEMLGEEVGVSREDADAGGGIGIFDISGKGKTTLVKIFLLSFSGKTI